MNVGKQGLWFIVVLLSPVLLANEPSLSNGDRTAVQKKPASVAGELDKDKKTDKVSGDKASKGATDPERKKTDERAIDKPIFSANDEFKPSEEVSEDLSIPFPVDI